MVRNREAWKKETVRHEKAWDHNLRSTSDVTGNHTQKLDGEIGYDKDL